MQLFLSLNSIMNYLNPHGNLVGMLDCAVEEFFFFFTCTVWDHWVI